MQLKSKILNIESGDTYIVALNPVMMKELSLSPPDRVCIRYNKKYLIAVVDVAMKIKKNQVGIFEEVRKFLDVKEGHVVEIEPEEAPLSVKSIRKKMNKKVLTRDEIYEIISDIVDNKLTKAEIASFISAIHMQGLSLKETGYLIRAMAETGEMMRLGVKIVADKHSIGGVPGNRTSMIIVPIVAAAGVHIPKTSSRAITDPAGTADVMEVLAPVEFTVDEIKDIVKKHKGCMVWGGAIHLAPADDRIISDVEYPLRIDPTEVLLASILAKKYAIGANLVLIDLPFGKGTKCTKARANMLAKNFVVLGKRLNIRVQVVKTDGSQPIGNGVGPALEARDVLWVLHDSKKAPADLKKKSLMMAGILLEMAGEAESGEGGKLAEDILKSGRALKKMTDIIKAQGGKIIKPENIRLARFSKQIYAMKSGKIVSIDNDLVKDLARLLGAPHDKKAGLYLYKKVGDHVRKKDKLFRIYSESKRQLLGALNFSELNNIYTIK